MMSITVNVHQVGFLSLYLPFYIAISKLSERFGWEVKYHVGVSDEDNIKRACRLKFKDKDNIHIVLTALHNLKVVKEKNDNNEIRLCDGCDSKGDGEGKCEGVSAGMDWFFPWVFVVKVPIYVFLKNTDEKIKSKIEDAGVRHQLSWEDIKEILNSKEEINVNSKEEINVCIYPEGSTINDVILNHILKDEEILKDEKRIEKINFDEEENQKKDIIDKAENPLVFTLNPHLYENDENYKLILKTPHNFFPFTGVALPYVKDIGITPEEIKLLYYLEEEYMNFMTCLQEIASPFFENKGGKTGEGELIECLKKETEKALQEDKNYLVYKKYSDGKEEEKNLELDVERFCKSFVGLYSDGVFRDHAENVIRDYLRERTSTNVVLFDPQIYKARVRDAIAYIFARNLSHIYGSNIIPYMLNDNSKLEDSITELEDNITELEDNIDELEDNICELEEYISGVKTYLEFLQERMDYIATVVSDESISPYAFIGVKLEDIVSFLRKNYKNYPFNYLYYNNKKNNSNLSIGVEEKIKSLMVAVPPVLYEQAFSSIFENILRNSAKYGKIQDNELCFCITTKETEDNFIKVIIIDKNVEAKKICEIAENLNKKLNKALVDPYMNIDYEGWGLKEVKISAAYLRGIPLEEIDLEGKKTPPIISVIPLEDGIGFEFYLYPFEYIPETSADERKDSKQDIPYEFMVINGKNENENIKEKIKKRKYTRIFTYDGEKPDWKSCVNKWIYEQLLSSEKEIKEYFISDRESYKDFYNNLMKNKDNYKDKIIVAYVRHLKNIGKEKVNKFLNNIKKASPHSYIHALKGSGFTYSLLREASKGDEFIKYKLIESALLRILILDERVQDRVKSYNYNKIELESLNIYIPKTPLIEAIKNEKDEENFDALRKELKGIKDKYNPHIVVVHVSLLEQSDEILGEDKFMKEILNGILKESDVILTTGRGRITSKYRHIYGDAIPISHILKVFKDKENINKYLLANTLIGFNRNIVLSEL